MNRKPLAYPQYFRKTSLALAIATTLALPVAFAAPGDPVGGEFQVNTFTTGDQSSSSVATDTDGDFVVTWVSSVPRPEGGRSARDIRAQRYNSAGVMQDPEFQVNATTSEVGQTAPDVAIDADGDFVITWSSFDTDGFVIKAQRYDSAGVKQGSEFRVDTPNAATRFKLDPAVAMDADGDFVVTWHNNGYAGREINARRYNNAGVAQGDEFRVDNPDISGSQPRDSDVAMDADGDFVVTWEGELYSPQIFAQRYSNAGVAQGNPIPVINGSGSFVNHPTVAMDADGDFVVAWAGGGNLNRYSDLDIIAKRYNSVGIEQDNGFLVSTSTTSGVIPKVAMDADGEFVVTWTRTVTDDFDVIAQRYSNIGMKQGNNFRVNTFTPNGQSSPTVALDADGDFVVAWQSIGQDGDGSGIYAQRYAGPGAGVTCGGRAATLVGTRGNDTLTGTSGDDVIVGLRGDDVINGLSGNDTLCGNDGNDRLLGGFGNDLIIGGPGSDTAEFGGNAGVGANLSTGTARGEGSDRLHTIENLTGTAVSDLLTGNAGNNVLIGGDGSDTLRGVGGNDLLLGGGADDNLDGGNGTDMCDGQAGTSDQASNCETVLNVP